MLNSSEILRGLTDTLILACLYAHDSYGYEINKTVNEKACGVFGFKEATLYTAFRRLEEAELIRSYWGGEQTGARRRYYSITGDGKKFFEENCQDWQKLKALIDTLISIDNTESKELL